MTDFVIQEGIITNPHNIDNLIATFFEHILNGRPSKKTKVRPIQESFILIIKFSKKQCISYAPVGDIRNRGDNIAASL